MNIGIGPFSEAEDIKFIHEKEKAEIFFSFIFLPIGSFISLFICHLLREEFDHPLKIFAVDVCYP
jgi:hypothetical protein